MRPPIVFANAPATSIEQLHAQLRGHWRQAIRAVMVLLSLHGLPAAQIANLLDYDAATVRRWIDRFNRHGLAGLADRPRPGRPHLGGEHLTGRITKLLARPGQWTLARLWRYLNRPRLSRRTLYRRVRLVAVWRRPKLVARGDPDRWRVVAAIAARLRALPRGAVVWAADETHVHLLPHIRAGWTLRADRPAVVTPGKNRQVTVFGAVELTTGRWVYRLGRRCAADFLHLLDEVAAAFPAAPKIVVICDNDSIHHARAVACYLQAHPRVEVLYGARYSPHDNPVERIWAVLKAFIANTAVSWPGRLRQIHAFCPSRPARAGWSRRSPATTPSLSPSGSSASSP
ncbi:MULTISPECIES: IS630 family transposase [unclassified Streptosporangium]|uniref:IS630 family transposase n=1 Tax=unclassified Streptosporangium TaxID=2632669 RepID=UPI002E27D40C|nr:MULTISPECIES: IS630 family transposase [unclassified Streptosporangium]